MLEPISSSFYVDTVKSDAYRKVKDLISKSGFCVLRNSLDMQKLEEIKKNIHVLISTRCRHLNIKIKSSSDFDNGFLDLCANDRNEGGVIYNACRRLLPVHQLAVDESLNSLSKFLMNTETIISCNLKAVRIDHPGEDKYLFNWHQDYPYIQDSEDGIVYWIPLKNVSEDLGQVVVAVGSHKAGIQKVKLMDPNNLNKNGAHTIELSDPSIVNRFELRRVPVAFGEVLAFNSLLLHRSSANKSEEVRWTVQIRHGNFENVNAIKRLWPGGMIEGVTFQANHKEFVESEVPEIS